MIYIRFFFFFQAEDGIRDVAVTGVQTCALPICPIRTRPRSALRGARARRRRRPCRERRRAGDRSYVTADQRFLDADVRRALGDRQRELAALAAASTHLIPGEVAGDVIDAVQRLEQIARQHHVLHQLGDLPVANHVAPTGREGKVLEHRLPAERPAGVDAKLDVADEIVEPDALRPWGDVRVRHANDRWVPERDGARVARRLLAELRGRLAGVQAADEDALLDEGRVLRGRAFVVVWQRPAQARRGAIVADIQDLLSEPPPQRHHLARLGVLIHEVGFGEMTERFVDEDAGELVVQNDGIRAAAHPRRVEQVDRALGDDAELILEVLHAVPPFAQPDRLESLFDVAVAPPDRDARPVPLVEYADESALVLAERRRLEAATPERDGGAPGAFDADFGVTGAGLFDCCGETVFQRSGFSFSLAR